METLGEGYEHKSDMRGRSMRREIEKERDKGRERERRNTW